MILLILYLIVVFITLSFFQPVGSKPKTQCPPHGKEPHKWRYTDNGRMYCDNCKYIIGSKDEI